MALRAPEVFVEVTGTVAIIEYLFFSLIVGIYSQRYLNCNL